MAGRIVGSLPCWAGVPEQRVAVSVDHGKLLWNEPTLPRAPNGAWWIDREAALASTATTGFVPQVAQRCQTHKVMNCPGPSRYPARTGGPWSGGGAIRLNPDRSMRDAGLASRRGTILSARVGEQALLGHRDELCARVGLRRIIGIKEQRRHHSAGCGDKRHNVDDDEHGDHGRALERGG